MTPHPALRNCLPRILRPHCVSVVRSDACKVHAVVRIQFAQPHTSLILARNFSFRSDRNTRENSAPQRSGKRIDSNQRRQTPRSGRTVDARPRPARRERLPRLSESTGGNDVLGDRFDGCPFALAEKKLGPLARKARATAPPSALPGALSAPLPVSVMQYVGRRREKCGPRCRQRGRYARRLVHRRH